MARELPPLQPIIQLPQPPSKKASDYLTSYNSWVYAAVSTIAQEVASVEIRLMRNVGDDVEEVTEHEALSLLNHVNEFSTMNDLLEATQVYLELVGEAFWYVMRDGGGKPVELWGLRPDWIKVVPDSKEFIKHYEYRPDGWANSIIFEKDDIIPFKYFNPLNPYRGRGAVQAAAMEIDIDQFSAEWNRSYFFNAGIPSLIISTEKKMKQEEIDRFVQAWKQNYVGRNNQHKIAFLSGDNKVEQMSANAKDMDFSEQRRLMRDSILSYFKVPKSVIGISEDVNRANAEASNINFMARVVKPKIHKLILHLNEFFLDEYEDGLFFDYVDPVPENTELNLKIYENGRKYNWLTVNEIREREGLDPVEGGDDLTAPTVDITGAIGERTIGTVNRKEKKAKRNMPLPVKTIEQIRQKEISREVKGDLVKMLSNLMAGGFKQSGRVEGQEREEVKKQFIARADQYEALIGDVMIRYFKDQEKIVQGKLESVKGFTHLGRKARIDEVVFNIEVENKKLVDVLVPIMRDIVMREGEEGLAFLGIPGTLDFSESPVVSFLKNSEDVAIGINETTRNALRETLADGIGIGESIDKLRDRVESVYNAAGSVRAEMIARSEAVRSSNFGAEESYRQSGVVEAKEWLTATDGRVCPFCDSMDGKIIGLGRKFFEKGDVVEVEHEGKIEALKLDYSDVKYPPLHTQCRCTLIPVLTTDRSLGSHVAK